MNRSVPPLERIPTNISPTQLIAPIIIVISIVPLRYFSVVFLTSPFIPHYFLDFTLAQFVYFLSCTQLFSYHFLH